MSETIKTAKMVAQICGGWMALMSGAVSVPFALLGLFLGQSHAKELFATLAFLALWVFVLRTVWKNYKLLDKNALNELNERDLIAQKSHISLLESQVQTLQVQIDDRMRRKKIKDALADFRIAVQNLTSQLRDITYYHFEGEVRLKFDQNYVDFQNKAFVFLTEKVGRSEATTFADMEKVPKVAAPPESRFDMPEWRDRWIVKEWNSNRLKYNEEQLEKIEGKLDSKDFILPLNNPKYLG